MADSTTLTVRLKSEVKDGPALLSDDTKRTRSLLAAEGIVAGIERGIADMRTGNQVSHDAATDELDAAIEDSAQGRA